MGKLIDFSFNVDDKEFIGALDMVLFGLIVKKILLCLLIKRL